jgi:hypothetical protein
MKIWMSALLCAFIACYLPACKNQAKKKSKKIEILFNKDKSFSVYYEHPKDKSIIYVHINQIGNKYCLKGNGYNVYDEFLFESKWKRNQILYESNEKYEFYEFYEHNLKNGDILSSKGYFTYLKNRRLYRLQTRCLSSIATT